MAGHSGRRRFSRISRRTGTLLRCRARKKSTTPPGDARPLASTNLDTAQYLAAWEATSNRVWFDRAHSIPAPRPGECRPLRLRPADLFDEDQPLPDSEPAPARTHIPTRRYPARLGFKAAPHRVLRHLITWVKPPGEDARPPSPRTRPRRRMDRGRCRRRVYTLDSTGVAPERMHWVCAEAASAAASSLTREDDLVDYARAVAWADSRTRRNGPLDPRIA